MKAVRLIAVILIFVLCTAEEWERVPSEQSELPPARSAPAQSAPARSTGRFSQPQLDQMLAPIALYPDPLIAQILMGATYPLEVAEAYRWLQVSGNASLTNEKLLAALQNEPWDPSVKSLVPFPRVLQMMNDNLEWTQNLGDAFMAQEGDVMDSVQRLRRSARATGTFAPATQNWVTTDDDFLVLESANPASIYVPCYSPATVYGNWPWAAYPPYSWSCGNWPWVGIPVVSPLWGWGHWRWHRHRLYINPARFNALNAHYPPVSSEIWRHDLSRRQGAPYRPAPSRAGSAVGVDAARGSQSLGSHAVKPGFGSGGVGGMRGRGRR